MSRIVTERLDTEGGNAEFAGRGEGKLGRQVASQIEQEIVAARLPVGTIFASQAELSERFSVSPSVVREAISILEQTGLVRMRRGRKGGLEVNSTAEMAVTRCLGACLVFADIMPDEVLAIRSELEGCVIDRAIGEISDEQASEILDILGSPDWQDANRGLILAHQMQLRLLDIVNNPVFTIFILVLSQLIVDLTLQYQVPEQLLVADGRKLARHRKRQLEAVIAADSRKAFEFETKIARVLHGWFRTADKRRPGRTNFSSDDPAGILELLATIRGKGTETKLTEIVCDKIVSDIRRHNLKSGDRIGTEAELLAQYGVSRGVLREAIRSLEQFRIVEPWRGKGGGLRVGNLSPDAVIESAELYLQLIKVARDQVVEVARPLELLCVEWAAGAVSRGDVQAKRRAETLLGRILDADPARSHHHLRDYYLELSRLSDHPILALFMRVLAALTELPPIDAKKLAERAGKNPIGRLDQVMQAIIDGDPVAARRRMVQFRQDANEYFR